MDIKRKILILTKLKEQTLGWNEYMCNNLKFQFMDGQINRDELDNLLDDLWMDRIPNHRTEGYPTRIHGSWYPMGDREVRVKNIELTIKHLENSK